MVVAVDSRQAFVNSPRAALPDSWVAHHHPSLSLVPVTHTARAGSAHTHAYTRTQHPYLRKPKSDVAEGPLDMQSLNLIPSAGGGSPMQCICVWRDR